MVGRKLVHLIQVVVLCVVAACNVFGMPVPMCDDPTDLPAQLAEARDLYSYNLTAFLEITRWSDMIYDVNIEDSPIFPACKTTPRSTDLGMRSICPHFAYDHSSDYRYPREVRTKRLCDPSAVCHVCNINPNLYLCHEIEEPLVVLALRDPICVDNHRVYEPRVIKVKVGFTCARKL